MAGLARLASPRPTPQTHAFKAPASAYNLTGGQRQVQGRVQGQGQGKSHGQGHSPIVPREALRLAKFATNGRPALRRATVSILSAWLELHAIDASFESRDKSLGAPCEPAAALVPSDNSTTALAKTMVNGDEEHDLNPANLPEAECTDSRDVLYGIF